MSALPLSLSGWTLITLLGAAALIVPVALTVAAGAVHAGARAFARRWLMLLGLGAGLVLLTKIAFMAWGLGSESFDFTGISGHSMLATAILPFCLVALVAPRTARDYAWAVVAGIALGGLVAVSRVVLGAHSVSEAVAGWLLGGGVALLSAWPARAVVTPAFRAVPLALGLMLAAIAHGPIGLPSAHPWEARLAARFAASPCLHTRASLHHRGAMACARRGDLASGG